MSPPWPCSVAGPAPYGSPTYIHEGSKSETPARALPTARAEYVMSPPFDDPDDLELSGHAADDLPDLPTSQKIDSTVAHSARIWDYWQGGKNDYPVDRTVGEKVQEMLPSIVQQARADRAFLGRAVRHLAGEAGIRQLLDIGTVLPTVDNTHEVAQRVAPESRIGYVDNDPLVLAHARALLTSTPEGTCDYLDADVHDPGEILNFAAQTLDFSQPIALMMLGVLHHATDTEEAYGIVIRLVEALPPGSSVAINHATNAVHGRISNDAVRHWITRFFDGLELVEPGVVSCSRWRPEALPWGAPDEVDEFCGVGRKLLKGRI
jgi:hypothetical protein